MYHFYNLRATFKKTRFADSTDLKLTETKTAIWGEKRCAEWKNNCRLMKLTMNPFVRYIVDIETLGTICFFHIIAVLRLLLCLRRDKNHGQNVKYKKRNSRLHCDDERPSYDTIIPRDETRFAWDLTTTKIQIPRWIASWIWALYLLFDGLFLPRQLSEIKLASKLVD